MRIETNKGILVIMVLMVSMFMFNANASDKNSNEEAKKTFCNKFLSEVKKSDPVVYKSPDPETSAYDALIINCKARVLK